MSNDQNFHDDLGRNQHIELIMMTTRLAAVQWICLLLAFITNIDRQKFRAAEAATAPVAPFIVGDWWQVAGNPDLGELTSAQQQVVDFGVWQARDGSWQIWSCTKATKETGRTRVFHRWEGRNLTDTMWQAKGIAMRADPTVGEMEGGLQAPFVLGHGDGYVMYYGGWSSVGFQTSMDGKTFTRHLSAAGKFSVFDEGKDGNSRDPMILKVGDEYICYYSAHPKRVGRVFARTSKDLAHWSDSRVVAIYGPDAKPLSLGAECPFVVEPRPGEFYLFETQHYGEKAQTTVLFSRDPLDFGGENSQRNIVTTLPIAAPEIIHHNGEWYVACLRSDFQGIQISRLGWGRSDRGQMQRQ